MTINEVIAELLQIKERNYEPEMPDFDPGTLEVLVQSNEGTYESKIELINQANDVWLVVDEPNYDI